ncbi:PAS domain-containing sensor histidine kinase [Phenylobacterium aquaticum]|uniref:PAS domain-containing hybrid sensor histidine kinase/response regulator n=1 Tax=Phenylobacterium aquaticum TaxID=1763816 RepID=UPI0026EC912D|nr:PAS domain-containing sensor histidine kinase [Phenylobacterium aquaticum]
MLRAMAEASQDCIWVLNPGGEVRYMNPRAQALLGRIGEAPQPALRALWPEESRFSLDRALAAAGSGQVFKFRAFFRGGEQAGAYWETVISPIRPRDGVPSHMLAVGRDVTAEVETHAFLDTVIQLLPSPLTVKNVADRRFVLVNRAAEDVFGLPAEDLLGRTGAEAFGAGGFDPRFREVEDRVLSAGEMARMDHSTADPLNPRHFAIKVLATHDDQGARHLITLADDVTERRATAESLGAALKAAEQASEAKSAFLANMSHEIRTPLNGIIAGADMLARDALSERSHALVSMIRASSETLERLLSDILDLARAESGRIEVEAEPFHAGEAVRSTAALFRLSAEAKGLSLELDLAEALDAPVVGDMGRLRQVLSNLLSNAVKFTQAGRIVLAAERTADGRARFTVRDTGVGFDPAAKTRLFGRFQQADDTFTRQFGGAGLGLAISRELVELMGGALDAESQPGQGACFWFEIPLPAGALDLPAAEAEPELEVETGLRVLLADDHPTNRQVVGLMLGAVAEITAVEDGAQAVEAFRRSAFDLVLMDMQMPVMDGLTAVAELRKLEAQSGATRTPIIMLTANTLPEHQAASAAAGADLHLGKPVTTQALFGAMEAALAEPAAKDEAVYANFGPVA